VPAQAEIAVMFMQKKINEKTVDIGTVDYFEGDIKE
jgi:hypothetical protein